MPAPWYDQHALRILALIWSRCLNRTRRGGGRLRNSRGGPPALQSKHRSTRCCRPGQRVLNALAVSVHAHHLFSKRRAIRSFLSRWIGSKKESLLPLSGRPRLLAQPASARARTSGELFVFGTYTLGAGARSRAFVASHAASSSVTLHIGHRVRG
jgi:hypothetical protein